MLKIWQRKKEKSGMRAAAAMKANHQAGFTLIELSIVMAIFGITTAMVFIHYAASERGMIVQSAAHRLAGMINQARDLGLSYRPIEDGGFKVGAPTLRAAGLQFTVGGSTVRVDDMLFDIDANGVGSYNNRYCEGGYGCTPLRNVKLQEPTRVLGLWIGSNDNESREVAINGDNSGNEFSLLWVFWHRQTDARLNEGKSCEIDGHGCERYWILLGDADVIEKAANCSAVSVDKIGIMTVHKCRSCPTTLGGIFDACGPVENNP